MSIRSFVRIIFAVVLFLFIGFSYLYFFVWMDRDYVGRLQPGTRWGERDDAQYSVANYVTAWGGNGKGLNAMPEYRPKNNNSGEYTCETMKYRATFQVSNESRGKSGGGYHPFGSIKINQEPVSGVVEDIYLRLIEENGVHLYGLAFDPKFLRQFYVRGGTPNLYFSIFGGSDNFVCLENLRLDYYEDFPKVSNHGYFCLAGFDLITKQITIVTNPVGPVYIVKSKTESSSPVETMVRIGTCKSGIQ